ncbi:MAG TPA: homoserine dehydrogenase, partial [Ruminococcus flavefaciens]|nr:homoserine dehydrogenase [Ruminococcus flavefaciens]
KLVASVTKLDNGKILPSVMPTLVSYDNIMAGVNDVFNAVLVYGDGVDQTMFYGRGAGKLPTASAVLGDVIETAKGTGTVLSQTWESASDDSFIENCDSYTSRWYFRVPADTEVDLGGTYSHDDGISYVTDEEMTFAQAKAKADEIGALAFMPVLE